MNILVTGANGFIGSRLCSVLAGQGEDVIAVSRRSRRNNKGEKAASRPFRPSGSVRHVAVGDLTDHDWANTLAGVDVVIHVAGRAHRPRLANSETYSAYQNDNVFTTAALGKACIAARVRRFVFLSSVKAQGEQSPQAPFSETDLPAPQDVYGLTKLEAERELTRLAGESSLEVVIIRPPLVYGPGVRANFLRLMKLVDYGLPLPFEDAHNKRSLIFLDNLVSSLVACAIDRRASGIYLVCDRELLSVRALLEELAKGLNRKLRLFGVPSGTLALVAKALGKETEMRRMFSPLVLSAEKITREINWVPPYTAFEGISMTARAYVQARRGDGDP